MANVLLCVTGSVAASRTPMLVDMLGSAGHAVRVVATESATYFFDPALLKVPVLRDADEWPHRAGPAHAGGYIRGEPILHIDLRRWADLLLLAPLDANTLGKLAAGFADNLLTCVWRCWDVARPVVLAPAMNSLMWESRLTVRHLRTLWEDWADLDEATGLAPPRGSCPAEWSAAINRDCRRLRIVGPIRKRLACGDEGLGAMAEVTDIMAAVTAALAETRAGGQP